MKTILLKEPGQLALSDTASPPALSPDEALVRVRRIGVCGTDLHAFKGEQPFFTYPRVLGHELGVEVVRVGVNDEGLRAGDRCAVEPYLNCDACVACRRGKTNCCVRLQVLGVHADGGMREFIKVPARKLHMSDSLALDQLALVEPLSIGAHAVARANVERGEFVLVIGAGPIGLSVIQFARLAGANVIVTDVSKERLQFAAAHFGVEFTVKAGEGALENLKDITSGEMPTAVFDATGSARSMAASFDLVAHGGRLIFVGLFQGDVTFHDPDAHRRELTLLCSRNSTGIEFKRIINQLEAGEFDIAPWITHRVQFGEVVAQFPRWLEPQSRFIKAVIEV
ncbi:MAG TPA: zinc-binding alcohol dehydrogenase family protein [Pyrinomonadaceae bacterium]|nr:zinc-binding alcohol dehydrogenase family protein [Pyrinomonadaceae bacterium]